MENEEKIDNLIYYYETKLRKYEDIITKSKTLGVEQHNEILKGKIELIKEFLTKLELIK